MLFTVYSYFARSLQYFSFFFVKNQTTRQRVRCSDYRSNQKSVSIEPVNFVCQCFLLIIERREDLRYWSSIYSGEGSKSEEERKGLDKGYLFSLIFVRFPLFSLSFIARCSQITRRCAATHELLVSTPFHCLIPPHIFASFRFLVRPLRGYCTNMAL